MPIYAEKAARRRQIGRYQPIVSSGLRTGTLARWKADSAADRGTLGRELTGADFAGDAVHPVHKISIGYRWSGEFIVRGISGNI